MSDTPRHTMTQGQANPLGSLLGLPLTYANLTLTEEDLAPMSLGEQQDLMDQLSYRQKYQLLQRSDHAPALLNAMTPTDLLLMLDAVGRTDAMSLVMKLDPQRLIRVFDLDCWQGTEYDQDKQLDWFGYMLQEDIDHGPEKVASLEYEYLLMFFSRQIKVHRKEWSDYPEVPNTDNLVTMDDYYHFEFLDPDSARTERLVVLLQNLYRTSFDMYMKLMEGLIWESPSGLQEFNYRSRNDRLLDWGYPDYLDALGILAAADADSLRKELLSGIPEAPKQQFRRLTHPPTVLHKLFEHPSFLLDVVKELSEDQRENLATELAYAGNRVLVAFKALTDLDLAERTLAHTHGFLSIGLENLSGGDRDQAAHILTHLPIWKIVRLGYNLQRKLRQTVLDFFSESYPEGRPSALPLLSDPLPDVLQGLLQMPPRYYEGLSGTEMSFREFRNAQELQQTESLLGQMMFLYDLHFRVLGLSRQTVEKSPYMPLNRDGLPVPTFVKVFFTLFARSLADYSQEYEPFSKTEFLGLLPKILVKTDKGFQPDESLSDRLSQWLAPYLERETAAYQNQARAFAQESLRFLEAISQDLQSMDYRQTVRLGHLILIG